MNDCIFSQLGQPILEGGRREYAYACGYSQQSPLRLVLLTPDPLPTTETRFADPRLRLILLTPDTPQSSLAARFLLGRQGGGGAKVVPEERGEGPALGVAWTVLEEAGSATTPQSPSQASRPGCTLNWKRPASSSIDLAGPEEQHRRHGY